MGWVSPGGDYGKPQASWDKESTVKSMKDSIASGEAGGRSASAKDPLGVHTEIGRKLKQYYDELIADEVPDRFADLLTRLEAAESAQKGS